MADDSPSTVLGRLLSVNSPTGALTFSGLVLMYVSAAALFMLVIYTYIRRDIAPPNIDFNNQAAVINYYMSSYSGQILMLLTALLSASIGYGLLRAAGTATKDTIPPKDYDLITQMLLTNNQEGINNYVKLSSLSGLIGAFTKLGLPGLPLATIALTLFFALLAIAMQSSQLSTSLFDLAKLTLGAFIGSYVQRSSSEVQRMVIEAQRPVTDVQKPAVETTGQRQQPPSTNTEVGGGDLKQPGQQEQIKEAEAVVKNVPAGSAPAVDEAEEDHV
jgi:hypothetical protein